MKRPLRVLVIEDSEEDTLLLAGQLRSADYEPTFERVDSSEALSFALIKPWDLIISDFTMPDFSGTDALEIVKKSGLDIPFLFLSGTLGEDAAVAAMKAGAQDYVMKGNPRRLIPAIERELREAEVKRERKKAREQIRRQRERIRALHEINLAVTSTLDLQSILELLISKIGLVLPYPVSTTVRLLNRESGKLESVTRGDLDEVEGGGNGWRAGRGLSQLVFESRAPLVIHNVQTNPGVLHPEFFRQHGLVSYLGVPLIGKDEVLGVLGFYTREEHEFASEEIEFLCTLANQVAVAIHNSRLYDQTKRQAEEMEKANTEKSEFLSVVSHELRTPVSAIVGYADLIRKGLVGGGGLKQETAAGRILSCSNELMVMTNSILESLRLQVGKIEMGSHEVHLGSFLADLKTIYEVPLNKEVRLRWNHSRHLPVVKTDGNKLRHILQNLINNAIKFTERGSITISARYLPVAKAVRFEVSDTGIGIPRESLSTIFERFRQMGSSQTRSHGGVGLGLHIVKKFTELLNGSIKVESQVGKGSTFTVTLPCEIVKFS